MQLDAVEAGALCAGSGAREELGQHARQFCDVRKVRIGDALAGAELEAFAFALVEQGEQLFVGEREQTLA